MENDDNKDKIPETSQPINEQPIEEKVKLKEVLDKLNNSYDVKTPIEKQKMSTAKIVGIVLLCIIGIPIIIFGICLIVISG